MDNRSWKQQSSIQWCPILFPILAFSMYAKLIPLIIHRLVIPLIYISSRWVITESVSILEKHIADQWAAPFPQDWCCLHPPKRNPDHLYLCHPRLHEVPNLSTLSLLCPGNDMIYLVTAYPGHSLPGPEILLIAACLECQFICSPLHALVP